MKKILSLIGLALLLAGAVNAQNTPIYSAQNFAFVSCGASTATNLGYVIDCRKQAGVALEIVSTNTVDSQYATPINLYYSRSVSGVYYDTNYAAIGWTPNGKTNAVTITNIASLGAGYIKLWYATNSAGGTTNVGSLLINYGVKINQNCGAIRHRDCRSPA